MNFKTTYILFGVLALILIGLTIALYVGPSPGDDNKFVFPSLNDAKAKSNPEEVDRVEIARSNPEEKVVFVRDSASKRWKVNGLRADSAAVANLVRRIYEADKTEIEAPKKLADWGLEKPETVVLLKRGDKPDLKLSLGKTSSGEGAIFLYVLSSDRPSLPLAVMKSKLDILLKDVASFRDRELVASGTGGDIQSVELAVGTELTKPAIGLVKSGSGWRYTAPEANKGGAAETEGGLGGGDDKAPTNVRALLAELANIKVEGDKGEDFVADDVKDLGKYNLGDSDKKLFITFKRSEEDTKATEQTLLVGIGKKAENKGDDKSEKYFACLKGENNIVRLAAKSIAPLLKLIDDPDVLRDKHLITASAGKGADVIVIRNANTFEMKDGKKVEKRIEFFKQPVPGLPMGHGAIASPWKMYRGDEVVAIEESMIIILERLLMDASVEAFPDKGVKESDLGVADEDKAEAVVEVWFDGIASSDDKKAKPKLKDPKKPNVKLIFGSQAGPNKSVAVKRIAEGEATALLWVKGVVFEKVSVKPLDYMSKTLPSFVDANEFEQPFKDVTKIELTREGKNFVLVREVSKDNKTTWKFEKPDDLKTPDGKPRNADLRAVLGILQTLARLPAVTLEAEAATTEALSALYGFGKPESIKVSVSVTTKVMDKEETKKYDYDFGKNKTDTTVFGKQSQRGMIFTVEKTRLAPLQEELIDSTIFAFDPAKVKSLKLVGWKSVVGGKPRVIELEPKAMGQWTVKGEADTSANTVHVNALVNLLANLSAAKFEKHNVKELDPAFELDVNKDGLVITVTVEEDGKPKTFEVTIGKAADGDKGYFAISPQAKGDLFYLKKADFEGPKKAPGYFFSQ